MQLNGAEIVIECLKEQGVDTIFGYPGGAILNVYDELYKHRDEIRHILRERGSTIRVESSPEIEVELDGELLGHTPLEFTMLRRASRVVVSRKFLEEKEFRY